MWRFPITTEKQHRKNFSKTDRTWRLVSRRKLVTVSPHSLLRLHSKQTTSLYLACSNHSNHLQPRTTPLKQQHPSATLTLPHFTHYILLSTLHTLHFTLCTPYLTLYSLHSSPTTRHQHPSATFTLRAPLLSLTPIFSSSSIAFLMFWPSPPNARRWTDQGGIEAHRHPIATWYIGLKDDRQGHQN